MATYTAIADVSETLVALLRDQFAARDDVFSMGGESVSLVAPDAVDEESETRLSVSLYRIEENASMKNTDLAHAAGDPTVSQEPPLALDLYYLVTAYPGGGSDDETAATVEQQRVLGLAMQTFHDNAVLSDDQLTGSLDPDVDLQISLVSTSVDELTGLWSTVPEAAFQPSAVYHVGPVLIDSRQREEVTPVTDRETTVDRTPER
ncbi:uncharacterized protein DUF4255 [Halohasta litchfieldiae]|jgi:hypothetical protein|uniref:Pvc16 N-terminal domain-containing protein n=1 Tax=Halohasta litchfieldiae TaxID=1073996 RepID=A0A1H6VA06_9EURY|nr:DUF4255 domain-containing protein [Halohasta litchfieldiae]ATW88961.1 uncharacterized protein DUF4255 [Halohasta litchfieldiae]SEJ01378.1 Protein of unknown function [Halohasta litchfieldiae]